MRFSEGWDPAQNLKAWSPLLPGYPRPTPQSFPKLQSSPGIAGTWIHNYAGGGGLRVGGAGQLFSGRSHSRLPVTSEL